MWKKTLLAAAVAGFGLPVQAVEPEAQSAPTSTPVTPPPAGPGVDAPTTQLETVVVEGTRPGDTIKADEQYSGKLPMSVRETPQSITVITRESLDDRQVFNLQQALELSAGVVQYSGNGPFAGQPSFGFNQTTIRGIDIDSIYDFRDDGFISGSFFQVPDLAIYDRIEVVKGPNSMLYGRGSVGGLINRIRKKPTAERRTDLEFSAGSFDTYRADFDTSGALFSNKKVRGRLVAAYEDSGSFVHAVGTERTVVAPSIEFDLTDSTRLLVQALYQSEDIIPNTGTPLRADGENFRAPRISRRQYNGVVPEDAYTWKTESASVQLDQDLADGWLASLRLSSSNIDTPLKTAGYAYGLLDEDGNTGIVGNEFALDRDTWSGELQVSGTMQLWGREAKIGFGADRNQTQYSRRGAYTEYLEANVYTATFPQPDPDSLALGFATNSKPVSAGTYLQAQVRPMDRLAVLLGLRYDKVWIRNVPYHDANGPAPELDRETVDKVTGRVGLTYDLSKQVSVYSMYAQSFQPELFATDINSNPLDPEEGEIYELGVKTEWFDGKLGVNAAVYRVDRENIPVSVDVPPDEMPYSISSGLQRSDGFEIEATGQPLPGWDLIAAVNFLDSEYKDSGDPLFGFQPGGTADFQFSTYSAYEIQTGSLKGLGFGATLFALDDRGIGFSPGSLPGYERVDVHAFYKGFKNVELNLLLRNVTDERYIEGADRSSAYAQFGSPAAAMLSIKYSI